MLVRFQDETWSFSEPAAAQCGVFVTMKEEAGPQQVAEARYTFGSRDGWTELHAYCESGSNDSKAFLADKAVALVMRILVVANAVECHALHEGCVARLAAEFQAARTAQELRACFGLADDLSPSEKEAIVSANHCEQLLSLGDW